MHPLPLKTAGYTLVEMLIAISIFMVFLAVVAGSYTTLVSGNRTANDLQKLYFDVRRIFDTLATEVRTGVIDYGCIAQPAPGTSLDPVCIENQGMTEKRVLAILHAEGTERTLIRYDADAQKLLLQRQSRETIRTSFTPGTWHELNSFPVENLSFSIFPLKNPYARGNAADDSVQFQPSVGIALTVSGHHFRTTYSSRTYGNHTLYSSK